MRIMWGKEGIWIGLTVVFAVVAVAVAVTLVGGGAPVALEKDSTAAVMRMEKTLGTVEVRDGVERQLPLIERMRLYNGYGIATDAESYAWINLDDYKLLKMDAASRVGIRKHGRKLETFLESGNIFFHVSAPLEGDESMFIRTSTTAVGIRGTSGWLEIIDEYTVRVSVLEGAVEVSVTDPLTGQVRTDRVSGGETVLCVVYGKSVGGAERCAILRERYTEEDVRGFVLTDVVSDQPLCEKIYQETGLDLRNLSETPESRLLEDEGRTRRELDRIQWLLREQEGGRSVTPEWVEGGQSGSEGADRPQSSGDGGAPGNPGVSGNDGAPGNPGVPGNDGAPGNPGVSGNDGAPGNPGVSGNDGEPGNPGVSGNDGEPGNPGVSDDDRAPGNPGVSDDDRAPGNPEKPENVITPERPENSVTPERPADPGKPERPVTSEKPVEPERPVTPESPVAPENPVTPEEPEPTYYTVRFDANGGIGTPESQRLKAGDKALEPLAIKTPVCEGYRFTGWYIEKECRNRYYFGKEVTGNLTLYAGWKEILYTVKFDANGGIGTFADQEVKEGERALNILAAPTRSGYCFTGWYLDKGGTNPYDFSAQVIGDLALYAGWGQFFVVSFSGNGGSGAPASLEVAPGGTVAKPSVEPMRSGCLFTGWYKDVSCTMLYSFGAAVNGSFTLYAGWQIDTTLEHQVTFAYNDGTGAKTVQTVQGGGKATVPSADPVRDRYKFTGWHTDQACTKRYVFDTPVTESLTLYAGWKAITYYWVDFDANGGSGRLARLEVEAGKAAPAPASQPIRFGYRFTGWHTDSSCRDKYEFEKNSVTRNMTLYAGWEIDASLSHTVTFDANGGSDAPASQTVKGGSCAQKPSDPSRSGFDFKGWYQDSAGNVPYIFGQQVTGPITLYAGWSAIYTGTEGVVSFAYSPLKRTLTISGNGAMPDYEAGKQPWAEYATEMEKAVVQNGITAIGANAFLPGEGIEPVVEGIALSGNRVLAMSGIVPSGIRAFAMRGARAGEGRASLVSVTIANTVQEIDPSAFAGCSNLQKVRFDGTAEQWTFTGLAEVSSDEVYFHAGKDTYYNYAPDAAQKTLTIEGSGDMGDGAYNSWPWLRYRSDIQKAVVEGDVTGLGSYAFQNCSALSEVTLPSGLVTIGNRAFEGCVGLKGITLPQTLEVIDRRAFSGSGLKAIEIPGNVAEIRNAAFYGCKSLAFVSLEGGITRIGEDNGSNEYNGVFENCTALRADSVNIPDTVTQIGWRAFAGCTGMTEIVIPDSVTKIDGGVLAGCTSLTDLTVPASFTSISSAFSGCVNLTSVTILKNESVTSIGSLAFYGCSRLARVALPDNITSIGYEAFYNCGSLRQITLPEGVTSIGDRAFAGSGLLQATLPESVNRLGSGAFQGCGSLTSVTILGSIQQISDYTFSGCAALSKAALPAGLQRIGKNAFYNCGSLNDITLPAGLQGIGEYAFYNCGSLGDITLPEGLTTLERYAFYESGLGSIRIPGSVTKLLNGTFYNCRRLSEVRFGHGVEYIGEASGYYGGVFEGCVALKAEGVMIPSTVKQIGNRAFAGCVGLTSVSIPKGVTTIGDGILSGCTGLTSVSISNSVTTIGTGALSGCTGLTDLTVPAAMASVESAFSGCTKLESVTLLPGGSVTSIGRYAFSGCSSLREVTLPSGITSIGAYAFQRCVALTEINLPEVADDGQTGLRLSEVADGDPTGLHLPEGLTSIGNYAFYECTGLRTATLPNSVTSIGEEAFRGCTGLTGIHLPDSLTSLGFGAFYGCSSIVRIALPDGLAQIENSTFYGCVALSDVKFPARLKKISYDVFYNCDSLGNIILPDGLMVMESCAFSRSGLVSIQIPGSVTEVYNGTFYQCKKLVEVKLGEGIRSIGEISFDMEDDDREYYVSYGVFEGCSALQAEGIMIPSTVKQIGNRAFAGCVGLTSVSIPKGVTNIGNSAFSGCSSLREVTLPDGIASIGNSAFSGCSSLREVTLPDGIASIGKSAFSGCRSLSKVTLPESLTGIGDGAFRNCAALKGIALPEGIATIGAEAFRGSGLTEINLPDSITAMGVGVFRGTGLTSAQIPEKLTILKSDMFNGCVSLTNVTLPEKLAVIEGNAFNGCSSLTSVILPDRMVSVEGSTFQNCASLTNVTLPHNLTQIGSYAFDGCVSLQSIEIPEGISLISNNAFSRSGLLSVRIPDSVVSIGGSAFANSSALTHVILPSSVTSIGSAAFGGCGKLTDVYYGGTEEQWKWGGSNCFPADVTVHYGSEWLAFVAKSQNKPV